MVESEVSYLISEMPELNDHLERVEIEQHYLSDSQTPLRLRRYGRKRFEITKKMPISPDDLSRQNEMNIPLDAEEYDRLLKMSRRGLNKTRWLYPLEGGLKAEIDVYHGPLEGLATVEVEFGDEESRAAFRAPDWFGADITQEDWATNSYLAGKSLEEIQPLVDKETAGK